MALLEESFRPDEHEDTTNMCLPKGEYQMQVIESSLTSNKNQNGTIMLIVLEVVDGEFSRRRVYLRLNYLNPNAQAQSISRSTLKQITEAIGVTDMLETEDMHFKPFLATLKIRVDKTGNYGDQNDLASARPLRNAGAAAGRASPGGGSPGAAARPAARPASPPSRPGASAGGRPWPTRAAAPAGDVDDDIPF